MPPTPAPPRNIAMLDPKQVTSRNTLIHTLVLLSKFQLLSLLVPAIVHAAPRTVMVNQMGRLIHIIYYCHFHLYPSFSSPKYLPAFPLTPTPARTAPRTVPWARMTAASTQVRHATMPSPPPSPPPSPSPPHSDLPAPPRPAASEPRLAVLSS